MTTTANDNTMKTENMIEKIKTPDPVIKKRVRKRRKKMGRGRKITLGVMTYTIVKLLGKGAYGQVFLVLNEAGTKFALKRISKRKWINNNEIVALYLLQHPGILKLHTYFKKAGVHYLLLDYVPDGDLFDYLEGIGKNNDGVENSGGISSKQIGCCGVGQIESQGGTKVSSGKLDEGRAQIMFRQLILALRVAHRLGIYHGDLRFENILVNVRLDQLIIGDWGICHFHRMQNTDEIVYNLYGLSYCPPEFFTELKLDLALLDVWMLGVMIYSSIIGYAPFEDTENEIDNIIHCRVDFPPTISPTLRDLLTHIFQPESTRLTLLQMLYHPWFHCPSNSLHALLDPHTNILFD